VNAAGPQAAALIAACALGLPAPGLHAGDLILPGDRIGALSLGTDLSALEDRMGGPAGRDASAPPYQAERWKADGHGGESGAVAANALGDDLVSCQVWTTSAKFSTAGGLHVGSTLGEIRRAFPKLRRITPDAESSRHGEIHDALEQGIAFEFPAGAAPSAASTRVIVHAPGTNPVLRPPTAAGQRLADAAKSGDTKAARKALDDGADPSIPFDWWRGTPLLLAVNSGHADVARLLLDRGAYVDAQDISAQTPLLLAVRRRSPELVCLLLSRGANAFWTGRSGATLMIEAAGNGDADTIALLAKKGVPATQGNISAFTPLHAAALGSHADAARALIKLGADVDSRTSAGATPLLVAVQAVLSRRSFISHHEYGNATAVVKALLDAGTRPDAATISCAERNGLDDIVALLKRR